MLRAPCVAIVGTRDATPEGRAVAFEMAGDLARAGVCVVSGLALGIDGAAHAGALHAAGRFPPGPDPAPAPPAPCAVAPPAGVAASGVDVPYPRRHRDLWEAVAAAGTLLSETPPGRPAQAWRFPARNRVIAGLVRLVVVVESHAAGGSLLTVEAAADRGVEVRAVPGPVRSPASAGTNQLIYDGAGPVRSATDVLDALGVLLPARDPQSEAAPGGSTATGGRSDFEARAVLQALGWRPASVGQLMARTGLGAATVTRCLLGGLSAGTVAEEAGWWVRRR